MPEELSLRAHDHDGDIIVGLWEIFIILKCPWVCRVLMAQSENKMHRISLIREQIWTQYNHLQQIVIAAYIRHYKLISVTSSASASTQLILVVPGRYSTSVVLPGRQFTTNCLRSLPIPKLAPPSRTLLLNMPLRSSYRFMF